MRVFESELARIPDILAVRSVNEGEDPREIHVLASPGRAATEIVSDIESLAVLRGVPLQPHDIHVVQLKPILEQPTGADDERVEDDPPAAPPPPAVPTADRIEIDGVMIVTSEGSARALATLRRGERVVTGTAVFVPAGSVLRRGVADATLAALLELFDARDAMAVETAVVIPLPPHEVALVVLALVNGSGEQVLVGSSLVGSAGINEAIASAVLDAAGPWVRRHGDRSP